LDAIRASGAKFAYPLPKGELLGLRLPTREQAQKYTDAQLSSDGKPSHNFHVYALGCLTYPETGVAKALLERYSGADKSIVLELNSRAGLGAKPVPLDAVSSDEAREALGRLSAEHDLVIYQPNRESVIACRRPSRLEMQIYTDAMLTGKDPYPAAWKLVVTTLVFPSAELALAILERFAMLPRAIVDGIHEIAGTGAEMIDLEGN
jgi:hypothetical protein